MKERISARKSCKTMGISRRGYGLRAKSDRDAPLREALRKAWRPNMGYRMAHALVRKEFAPLNVKRVHRVWKEERLGRVKRYRKRRTGNSVPLSATHPNHVWAVDFVFDSCLNGTKLKVLAVKDEFTKECLAERLHREFQLPAQGRVPGRGVVPQPGRRAAQAGRLPPLLQPGAASLIPGLRDPSGRPRPVSGLHWGYALAETRKRRIIVNESLV